MQVTIHISEEMYLADNWFLLYNDQIIKLDEKETTINLSEFCEFELLLFNNLKKKRIAYFLLWIVSMLIAPINIFIMNTEIEWYNKVILSSMSLKIKCNLQNNTNIFVDIISRNYSNYTFNNYKVKNLTADSDLTIISLHEDYNNNTLNWEFNKYLSKTFSFEFWTFIFISFICRFSQYCYKNYLIMVFGIAFILIFIFVTIYAAYKYKKMKLVLKTKKSGCR